MRIILKLLAAPFVLALTLLVAVLNFAFSFASWVFCAEPCLLYSRGIAGAYRGL